MRPAERPLRNAVAPSGAALAVLFAAVAGASEVSGRVVGVTDGHSLVVLIDQRRTAVRIAGIAAPTGTQRHAIAARQSLIALCGSEPARIEARSRTTDGILMARIWCNGVDAGAEQVRRGHAIVMPYAGHRDAALTGFEAAARAAKRGVWSTPQTDGGRGDSR